jgi:hypothetical protein
LKVSGSVELISIRLTAQGQSSPNPQEVVRNTPLWSRDCGKDEIVRRPILAALFSTLKYEATGFVRKDIRVRHGGQDE